MKFLHAADLHIDSPLGGLSAYDGAPVERIRGATRRAVENMVETAISSKVDLIVIAGDVFDGDWKDYNTGLFWIAELCKLEAAGIPVVFVAGNHDASSEIGRKLRLPPNVTRLSSSEPETRRFDQLDVAVVGQSYPTRAVSVDLAAAYPLADPGLFTIGLLHTSLDGRPDHASYAPTSLDVLRGRGYQYWGLGHVHQREEVLADPWIVFPGNLQGRHARERGSKGASLVTVEGNSVQSVEHLSLDVVRWHESYVDATELEHVDDVLAVVGRSLESAVAASDHRLVAARVRIVGRSPAHAVLWRDMARLEAEIRALGMRTGGVWVEKVKLDTRRPAELADREDGDTIGGIAARVKTLRQDSAALTEYESLFTALRNKIAADARSGESAAFDTTSLGGAAHIADTLDASLELIMSLLDEADE
jgi:DNA repair protein SbcD/Mre11